MAGWRATDGLRYYRSPKLAGLPEVVHGFFTRQGGASPGAYHSLNVSLAVGDGQEPVAENLRRMRQALRLSGLAGAAQVHGGRAAVITSPGQARLADIPEVDILITTVPGLGLLIKQADCQAVMLFDPQRLVAANIHSGWRGSVNNIIAATIKVMTAEFATDPAQLLAAISPSLGPCCAEFVHYQQELPGHFHPFQVKPNYFNFRAISRRQLEETGVKPANIAAATICTVCDPNWFSYRREKKTSRFCSVIGVRSEE